MLNISKRTYRKNMENTLDIDNMRVKVQQMEKQGQCDAQNALDILSATLEKD